MLPHPTHLGDCVGLTVTDRLPEGDGDGVRQELGVALGVVPCVGEIDGLCACVFDGLSDRDRVRVWLTDGVGVFERLTVGETLGLSDPDEDPDTVPLGVPESLVDCVHVQEGVRVLEVVIVGVRLATCVRVGVGPCDADPEPLGACEPLRVIVREGLGDRVGVGTCVCEGLARWLAVVLCVADCEGVLVAAAVPVGVGVDAPEPVPDGVRSAVRVPVCVGLMELAWLAVLDRERVPTWLDVDVQVPVCDTLCEALPDSVSV